MECTHGLLDGWLCFCYKIAGKVILAKSKKHDSKLVGASGLQTSSHHHLTYLTVSSLTQGVLQIIFPPTVGVCIRVIIVYTKFQYSFYNFLVLHQLHLTQLNYEFH